MHVLIFEGIATSGKSTLIKVLANRLSENVKVTIASEDTTHVPIMEQRADLHIDFFENLIRELVSDAPAVVLIDRLYMTQAYRAKCDLKKYKGLEELLLKYGATTIFLKVAEDVISERIQKATRHRNPEWAEYVQSHGEENKYADYYIKQQRSQLKLLEESKLPFEIFNTSHHEYEVIVEKLASTLCR